MCVLSISEDEPNAILSNPEKHLVGNDKSYYIKSECSGLPCYFKKNQKNMGSLRIRRNVFGKSNPERYFGNPDIFGPQQDVCGCQGGGCPRCWH